MEHKLVLKDRDSVTIRNLQLSDKDNLYQMYDTMSQEALRYSIAPYSKDRIKTWLDMEQDLISIVAENNDRLVGYAEIQKQTHPHQLGICHLNIYLHQDYQGKGLGTFMMTHLLNQAQHQNIHKINLEVVADNIPALQLFKKFGFEPEGRIRDGFNHNGEYLDVIPMGKILNKPK